VIYAISTITVEIIDIIISLINKTKIYATPPDLIGVPAWTSGVKYPVKGWKIMNRFKTKTVVITGGGSGLGRRLALDFSKLGWRIALCDIDLERCEETARLMPERNQSIAVKCDVTKPQEIQSLADTILAKWGSVDIIINNAGVPVVGFMEKVSLDDWKFEIDIMLMSVVYGCRTFIPVFKKQGWGHIVNIASLAGIVSLPEMSPYNATKAGVISLSETLRVELRRSNIGVTVVCPTFFKSNLLEKFRYTDKRQLKMADSFFNRFSFSTTENISANIISAIKKNKLFVLPQPDSKFYWYIKRLMPNTFHNFNALLYARGIMDRILRI
jgi:NAD(P)-dependent dehydrogenase (short-subunit alcohol dehydrogenase family)